MVDPPEPVEKKRPNCDRLGEVKPEHMYDLPQEDARYLRSVVENAAEIMKVNALDGALLLGE